MNLKYKIVEVDSTQHSIVVRFYTDKVTEEMLATDTLDGVIRRCRTDYSIDLPVPTPEGADLATFISLRAPKQWFETQEAVLDQTVDTSLSSISPLLNIEAAVVTPNTTPTGIPVV